MHGAQQVTSAVLHLAESARLHCRRQEPRKAAHLKASKLRSGDAKAPQALLTPDAKSLHAPPSLGSPAYIRGTGLGRPLPMLFRRQPGAGAEDAKRAGEGRLPSNSPPPGLPPPGLQPAREQALGGADVHENSTYVGEARFLLGMPPPGLPPPGLQPPSQEALSVADVNEAPHNAWSGSATCHSAPRATISIAEHLAAPKPQAPATPQAPARRQQPPSAGDHMVARAGGEPAAGGPCLRLLRARSPDGPCVVEWSIDNLRSKLRVSRGFPLLSPPCEVAGLADVRVMFVPGCNWLDYAGTATRRHRKRQPETAMATEGAEEYGALKLKAGEFGSQVGEVSFRFALADGQPGPIVRCDFAERPVHSCDLTSDWRKHAEDAGDCLRLRLEFF
uniref:Uncharacterized protein n=1 Tax=Zooxanthella nutricula TaxID=1333877 RepID=A0A7S2NBD5_9DINO|mmetsp:Transcript_23398/g.70260  ORF Transcript_23398/g.70260 Transcript_23398/m.70260 type:complete len:390 (+) Transcript_23398:77-1246(+)